MTLSMSVVNKQVWSSALNVNHAQSSMPSQFSAHSWAFSVMMPAKNVPCTLKLDRSKRLLFAVVVITETLALIAQERRR